MPDVPIFTIFLASPGDVLVERNAAAGVVDQLNVMFGSKVRLRLLRWEVDVAPNVGVDPQSVVNEQIADHYDILLGVFWGRIGTPTARARSGSVEEVDSAIARAKADPKSIAVMIYFKDKDLPFETDPIQLKAVQELRSELQNDKGALSKTFKDTNAFERMLLVDLYGTVERLLGAKSPRAKTDAHETQTLPPLHSSDADDLSLGYFDLLELHDEQMHQAVATMASIGQAMDNLTAEIQQQTAKIPSVKDSRSAREIFDSAGAYLSKFASDLRESTLKLNEQQSRGYNALIRAIVIGHEDDLMKADEVANLDNATSTLIKSYHSSSDSIAGMRQSIEGLSRFTTKLVIGRNEAVVALNDLLAKQGGGLDVLFAIKERLSNASPKLN